MPRKQKRNPFRISDAPDIDSSTIAVGAEAANVIQVTLTTKTPRGKAFANVQPVLAVVADTNTTGVPTAAAPSGGVAVGVGTQLAADIAGKAIRALTSAAGVLRLDVTEVGIKTFYIWFLIGGRWKVSPAITFA